MSATKIKSRWSRDKKRTRPALNGREGKPEPRARKNKVADDDDSSLKVALRCASIGLPVVPLHGKTLGGACTCGDADCERPGRHPRTRHGLADATTHRERVKKYWAKWRNAKDGILTGGEA